MHLSSSLLLLPLLAPLAISDYSQDYYDYERTSLDTSTPLDYAVIYDGLFSYENHLIMFVQNVVNLLATTVTWGLVAVTVPPRLPSSPGRVRREETIVSMIPSTHTVARWLQGAGDLVTALAEGKQL